MPFGTVKGTAPAHWASYLINGDASGLDYYNTPTDRAGDRDIAAADKFAAWMGGPIVSCTEESDFMSYHDARQFGILPADCLTYTALIECKCATIGDCAICAPDPDEASDDV